jgi:hypothetical protein
MRLQRQDHEDDEARRSGGISLIVQGVAERLRENLWENLQAEIVADGAFAVAFA